MLGFIRPETVRTTGDPYYRVRIIEEPLYILLFVMSGICKVKGKISPITGPRCPEGSRKLRFPDFVTMAQAGGKVVSLTHRPLLPPGNTPGTHFC